MAALLVTATALAQTPPSGAPGAPLAAPATSPNPPAAQPGAPAGGKYVTDAEMQKQIDAQVEAAKKELREEMRAQAATVAATSAGGTWEAEAAAHRKLDLVELHGYFRVRPELLQAFDLNQPPDAYGTGYWLFPRPNGTANGAVLGGGHSVAGTNMRFQLDPTINVSEEVRIRAQINALDNVVWGSTPQYAYIQQNRVDIGILNETAVPPIPGVNSTQSNIAVTRVWGEVATPVGLLKFGRMGDQFGMGIVHNDGNCLDCNYGVTVDRFEFIAEPLPGFLVIPMLDFNVEGLVGGSTNTQGQPYDVTNTDDSHTFGIVLARKDSDLRARAKIDAGGTVVNYGFYFQYRSQTYEYVQNGSTTNFFVQDPYVVPSPSLSRIPRFAYLFIPDLWFKFENKSFRIELEMAAYLGKAQACQSYYGTTSNQCNFNQQLTIAQYGGALQTEYRLLDGALKIGLEVGAASGDSAPGFGDKPNRPSKQKIPNTTGAQWGDYDGAQYGRRPCRPGTQQPICIDNDIRNFRFNQDYRIDLILWKDIIGGVTDAAYIRLPVSYAINDSFSVFGNFIYSRMIKATSTPSGSSTQLGIELDAGVKYQSDDGFYAQLAYGVLFPFDALRYGYLTFSPGAGIAQAIRAQLGIRF
ncbi:MAG: TIGR04551 family protein [Myxococcaceae bacterium]